MMINDNKDDDGVNDGDNA